MTKQFADELRDISNSFGELQKKDPSIVKDAEGSILYGIDWQRFSSKPPLARECTKGPFGHTPIARDLPVIY